jgi:hypothetical protein
MTHKAKDLTTEELELLIEQKIIEVLGDPDSGLELKDEFRNRLRERLNSSPGRLTHKEVARKLGYNRVD